MNQKVWGHRGCRGAGNPPENSLSAFQFAIDAGVGGIELDAQLSQDGAVVVFHDSSLARMTGVAGTVSSRTLTDLGSLHLQRSSETIPTLDEVLNLVDRRRKKGDFVVNIELKDPHSAQPVAAIVLERLAAGWSRENFLISSFDMACLREMRILASDLPIGVLFECPPEDLAKLLADTADIKPCTVNIPSPSLTPATFDLILSVGAIPIIWTPQETKDTSRDLRTRLAGRGFIVITDFPKEALQVFKPSKARATATGVLAACLSYGQQEMLFRPRESGLEKLRSPAEYPELTSFGFSELQLIAEDGVPFIVWERKGGPDQPHFLLFHGNRAHWGDTGVGEPQRDRRARLKFISQLASAGAGVTAVTLRGFGGSSATPSEAGFVRDLRATCDHLAAEGFQHRRLVVAGESLGTWAATQTAVLLTQRHSPPALVSLQNPFTRMADVGELVVSQLPIVRSLHIGLSASALDRCVLKSHFYTANLFEELSAGTVIHIATSGKDTLVHPSHSDKLSEIARTKGLRVVRDLFPDAEHHNIPPVDYARRLLCLGVESCLLTSDPIVLWEQPVLANTTRDHLPHL